MTWSWLLVVYFVGWPCAVTYFLVSSSSETKLPAVLRAGIAIFFVALGSIWPLFVLARLGMLVWHLLGHPGRGRAAAAFSKWQRERRDHRACHHNPIPMGDKYEWCGSCGAMREKPHDWILPMDPTIRGMLE